MFAIGGFKIEGEPYITARHRYFRAERLADGLRVLLKTGLEDVARTTVAEGLQYEFEMLQQVQGPMVVKPASLERDDKCVALALVDPGVRPMPDALGKPLNTAQFLAFAVPLVEGVLAVHKAGLLHKNIQPESILLSISGDTLQLGGLEASVAQQREVPSVQYPTSIAHNLRYVAPEQTGLQNQMVDRRADLYSVGVIFYQLLAGTPPFRDEDPQALVLAHVRASEAPLARIAPTVPRQLVALVHRLLEKRADDRYQSAEALLEDLKQFQLNVKEGKENRGFPLGRLDCQDNELRLHAKLYERDKQLKELKHGFQQAAQGERVFCLIQGEAGSGKSALARELTSTVVTGHGYFVAGAFDPVGSHIPYAVFMQAFSDLIGQILTEGTERLDEWEENLKEQIGRHRAVISELVPELEIVLGSQKVAQSLNPVNTQNRFNQAFVSFVRAFATEEHPLVLFLDNLQWIDSASQSFLHLILCHAEIRHLMVIGAVRTEDYTPDHPLHLEVEQLRGEKVAIHNVTLPSLSPDAIQVMLEDALLAPRDIAEPSTRAMDTIHELGNLLTVATHGNPFFIREFLTNLQERQRLVHKLEGDVPEWRLDRIRPEDVAKSVEQLIALRMQRLPEATRNLLQLAAAIGIEFDLATLVYISEFTQKKVTALLQPAVDQGFLVYAGNKALLNPLSESERNFSGSNTPIYHFAQNLVQLTAYEQVGPDERRMRHLRIGRLFMADLSTSEREALIYTVLRHLNESRGLVIEASENVTLTELNLTAARKAKACLAYGVALDYATVAFTTFDKSWWSKRYKLTHALYRERAELEYLHGNMEGGDDFINVALRQTRSSLEKAELYTMQVTQLTAIGETQRALKVACHALKELRQPVVNPTRAGSSTWMSWKFRQAACKTALRFSFMRSRLNLRGRNLETLQKLEPISNPEKRAVLQLLAEALVPAYYTHRELWFLLATRVINLTFKHGIAGEAAPGFAAYGVLSNILRNEPKVGYDFGLFAERLSRKFYNRAMQCQACYLLGSHLLPWVRPLRELESLLDSGYTASIEAGELHYGSAILINKICLGFFRNLPPGEIQERMDLLEHFTLMMQSPRPLVLEGFQILLAEVTGDHEETAGGLDRRVQDFINQCYEAREFSSLGMFLVLRAVNLQWIGHSEVALHHLVEARNFSSSIEGTLLEAYAALCEVCAIADLFREATHRDRGRYRTRLRALVPQLKEMAAHCPENFQTFSLLAQASLHRIEGTGLEAVEICERAAVAAQTEGLHAVEGYAAEAAATVALRRGNGLMASAYASQALRAYRRWGSPVKLAMFAREFSELIRDFGIPDDEMLSGDEPPSAKELTTNETSVKSHAEPQESPDIERKAPAKSGSPEAVAV